MVYGFQTMDDVIYVQAPGGQTKRFIPDADKGGWSPWAQCLYLANPNQDKTRSVSANNIYDTASQHIALFCVVGAENFEPLRYGSQHQPLPRPEGCKDTAVILIEDNTIGNVAGSHRASALPQLGLVPVEKFEDESGVGVTRVGQPIRRIFDSVFDLRDALLAAGAKVPIKLPQAYIDELKKGDDAKDGRPELEREIPRDYGRERTMEPGVQKQKEEEKNPEYQQTVYPPLSVAHAREGISPIIGQPKRRSLFEEAELQAKQKKEKEAERRAALSPEQRAAEDLEKSKKPKLEFNHSRGRSRRFDR